MASSSSSSSSAAASPFGRPSPHPPSQNLNLELQKKIRNHEIAIGELNGLSSSRGVYQKIGNIYFRKDIQTAKAFEQKQLDTAKAQFQKFNTA